MHRYACGNGLVAHGVKHGMAGAIGYIAGAPFGGAAKVAAGNQAVGGVRLANGFLLAVFSNPVFTALHPAPWNTPGGKLTNGLGRGVGKHAHHFLVCAPVRAAHGIGKVQVLVVAGAAQAVAQAGLHTTLGRSGM